MIIDTVLSVCASAAAFLIGMLPTVVFADVTLPLGTLGGFIAPAIQAGDVLFPLHEMAALFVSILALRCTGLSVALLFRALSLLPFLGNGLAGS